MKGESRLSLASTPSRSAGSSRSGSDGSGGLLLLRVRWAPEFLLAVAAALSGFFLYLIYDQGYSFLRLVGVLCVGPGVIHPYRLLRSTRPGTASGPDGAICGIRCSNPGSKWATGWQSSFSWP